MSEIETLAYVGQNSKLDVAGLLFAGILISSLGAIMDISMSVTSHICEMAAANPRLSWRALFSSGMTVGRDMMGTMSHTLILAFAGGAVNALVIIYAYAMPYLEYWNEYAIGIEILRGLSGSIGIIASVPIGLAGNGAACYSLESYLRFTYVMKVNREFAIDVLGITLRLTDSLRFTPTITTCVSAKRNKT